MSDIPRDVPFVDHGRYPVLETVQVPAFELVLCSPDTINEIGRDAGLPIQAGALTDRKAGKLYLRWPPAEPFNQDGSRNPVFEYGMRLKDIERALGYELLSNWLLRENDPRGR